MLLFKKCFYEAIRSGRKTTTLRYWKSPRVRPGSVHAVPHLGRLSIESVDPVDPESLSDADARDDGFDSAQALRDALSDMYPPEKRVGRTLYRVRFAFIPASGQDSTP